MPIRINVKSALMYIAFAAACIFLNGSATGVPMSLGLYFSLLICGGNLIVSPLIYIAASAVHFSLTAFLCSLAEGAFLLAITAIYRRTGKKIRFEAAVYSVMALVPFVTLSDWDAGGALYFIESGYAVRAIAAAVVLILFLFSYKSVYACIFRLGRCRLKEDELFCLAALFTGIGIGAINLAGQFAYCAFAAFGITFSVRFFKGPSAVLCALVLSLPPAATMLDITPVTAYIVISAAGLLFLRAGRAAPCAAACAAFCALGYFDGWYDHGLTLALVRAATIALCCTIAAIPSEKRITLLMDTLTVKKVLTDAAINRERERAGEKLFRISEVFREVECAFKGMDEAADEAGAKKRVAAELKERLCSGCERRQKCEKSVVYTGFYKLVEAGAVKGKVNLIDLPPAVTQNCTKPADVIHELNLLLAEYRRFMTEAENARAGRLMLADQAKGISAVLKNNAVELCREKRGAGEEERNIVRTLASCGIACPELYINGDEREEICAVIVGFADLNAILAALWRATGERFQLRNKINYGGEKACYIFCRPPRYDAVFGVASIKKSGEKASGDTHSVIRINEHRFLMALSDGMGSGEYARKVSRTAISLIEAFYRAEMPEGTVLETINKLLTFSRDERFACIDICSVDLNTGGAEFVKIGSPAAIILRGGKVKVLESESLPLGILDGLRPTVAKEKLCDGDMLIFMSDGITSAFDSTPELVEFLQPLKPLNPQNLADSLLAGALKRTGGKAEDDMTVLCTRIFATVAEEEDDRDAATA